MRWWLVLAVIGAFAACAPHVTLVPPPATLTPDQRIAAFNRLRGVREKTTTTILRNCIGDCVTRVDKVLYLADGTAIHHVEDLLPMLPADSESAVEIRAAARARRNGRLSTLVIVAVVIATWAISERSERPGYAYLAGAGLTIPLGLFDAYEYRQVARHEGRANLTYNEGLAEQLYLCVREMQLVPCETVPMPGAPAPTPRRSPEPLPSGKLALRTF